MTINDFLKSIDYEVSVELLGEMKNHRYYIQNDLPDDEDVGEPLVVEENVINKTFTVCQSNQASALIKLFSWGSKK